jgi:hypothetical protein
MPIPFRSYYFRSATATEKKSSYTIPTRYSCNRVATPTEAHGNKRQWRPRYSRNRKTTRSLLPRRRTIEQAAVAAALMAREEAALSGGSDDGVSGGSFGDGGSDSGSDLGAVEPVAPPHL